MKRKDTQSAACGAEQGHGAGRQTQPSGRLQLLDEETLLITIRTRETDGNKIWYVFEVVHDETSCVCEEASKGSFDQGAANSNQVRETVGRAWTGASGSSQKPVLRLVERFLEFSRRLELLEGCCSERRQRRGSQDD